MLVLFIYSYITRLASKEIFSPSKKIHREVGRAKDLSAPPVKWNISNVVTVSPDTMFLPQLAAVQTAVFRKVSVFGLD